MPAILVKLFFATTLALGLPSHHAFYFPGVHPESFAQGMGVSLKVNKLTSSKTLLPIDYYTMPFCQPENGPLIYSQILGQLLAGDRIQSSPYTLRLMEDVFCQQLCVADLGEQGSNKLSQAIRNDYHHNWIVDNLPSATKFSDSFGIIHHGWKGFPVGYESDGIAKIYNHVNIEVMYHPVDDQPNIYRIVRFTVQPFSIRHDFNNTSAMDVDDDDMDQIGSGGRSLENYSINDPIPSCDPSIPLSDRKHTNGYMSKGKENVPQDAHGQVLFTYDVIWIRRDDLHWASRWEVYMSMDHLIPPLVHWYSICNSLMLVLMLSALFARITYNSLRKKSNPQGKGDPEIQKWKLLHADVFRPPTFSPLLLSVACGTGAQLLCTAFFSIVLSAMGFLNPSRRGSLLTAILVLYALMGTISGYVTVHFFKIFQGKLWYRAALCSALAFPGLCFVMFLVIISTASSYGSTYANPLATVKVLLLWLVILTPLVFLGGYMGYQQSTLEFPVKTSRTPRKIPNHPCYIGLFYASLNVFAGISPFGAIFVEYYFILGALWGEDYYYEFSFLFLVFVLMAILCAGCASTTTFFRIGKGNYHWWWYSFLSGGSIGIWVFLYSIFYFQRLDTVSLGSYIVYFGYMGMISMITFLMTGFIGIFASLMFNIAMYGAIAIDVDETKSLFTEEMTAQETDT